MNIEKLPSGNYRITQMVDGKRYRLTVDHKPTKREAEELIREIVSRKHKNICDMTFEEAALEYISSKSNILSPSTIRSYYDILKQLTPSFKELKIKDVEQIHVQHEINVCSKDKSPKTARNYHGFISPVIEMFNPSLSLHTSLPQKQKNDDDIIPTDEEVRAVIEASKSSRYYIPFMLAACGLRRSEICALTLDDLDGNMLHIHRAKVLDTDDRFVIKEYPKTTDSNRRIYLPDVLVKEINNAGLIYDGHPDKILENLCRFQKKLNIEHFKLHAFRKYYASMAHALGIPDKYIMKYGGWSTDNVLKDVYMKTLRDREQEEQKKATDHLSSLF